MGVDQPTDQNTLVRLALTSVAQWSAG